MRYGLPLVPGTDVSYEVGVDPVDDTCIDISNLEQREGGVPDVIDVKSLRFTCL